MKTSQKKPQSPRQHTSPTFSEGFAESREKYWQRVCKAKPARSACKIYEN